MAYSNNIFYLSKRFLCLFLLSTLLLPNILYLSNATLVGIDFGETYIKAVGLSNHKTFEIVFSTQSNRKIFNSVTFEGKEHLRSLGPTSPSRIFGDDVFSYATKRYHTSFISTLSLLGKSYDVETLEQPLIGITDYQHYFPIGFTKDEVRHTWKLHLNPDTQAYPEEIIAHILGHIKNRAIDSFGLPKYSNVYFVFTVPCSFGQRERQALKDAAEIADIRVLAITHSVLAAATNYLMDVSSNEPLNVIFLSLGSQRIDVGIAKVDQFKKSNSSENNDYVKLLSCVSIEGYGGQYIDLAIADDMSQEFEKKHGISLHETPRALKLILKQATKTKHILSANKETIFSVESILNDIDFKFKYNRTRLESLIDEMGYIEKVKEAISSSLNKSNLTISQIHGVELLGGVWRIPYIYSQLTDWLSPLSLGQHLNSDEAIAKGASFIAANYSASYHVKPLYASDISSNEYTIKLENLPQKHDQKSCNVFNTTNKLFHSHSKFYGNKKVNLASDCDLKLSLYEDGNLIETYNITGISHSSNILHPELPTPKVQINFKADALGLISFVDAIATYEEKYNETVLINTTVSKSPNTTNQFQTSSDRSSTNPNDTSDTNHSFTENFNNSSGPHFSGINSDNITNLNLTQNSKYDNYFDSEFNDSSLNNYGNSTLGVNTTKNEAMFEFIQTTKDIEKIRKHQTKLTIEQQRMAPIPLTKDQKENAKATLRHYDDQDEKASALSSQRNELESFIYRTKPLLNEDTYKKVFSDEKLEQLRSMLDDNENWLYDEPHANFSDVSSKFLNLKDHISSIKFIANEYEVRPMVIDEMENFLMKEFKVIPNISQEKPWIESQIIESLINELHNVKTWWNTVKEKQHTQPLDKSPAFTKEDVTSKIKEFQNKKSALEQIPKPKFSVTNNSTNSTQPQNFVPTFNDTSSAHNDTNHSTENSYTKDFDPDNKTKPSSTESKDEL